MISFLFCILFLFSFAHGQHVLVASRQKISDQESVKIQVESLFSTLPSSGYVPIRVTMANDSKKSHHWKLKFKSGEDAYFGVQNAVFTNSEYQVFCQSGETNTVSLVVPVSTAHDRAFSAQGESLQLEVINGNGQIEKGYMNTKCSEDFPSILMSEDLFIKDGARLNREIQSIHDCDFAGHYHPDQLPEDWRCYYGYDAILMSEQALHSISPGARTALKTWIRQGGEFVYCSQQNKIPKLFSEEENLGMGKITHSLLNKTSNLDSDLTSRFIRRNNSGIRQYSLNNGFGRSWGLVSSLAPKSFESVLVILILLAFAFLVGPVNLFVFAKAGQRHRLFITTPIISLITSLILGLLVVIQDGFGGKGVRLALMEIGHGEDHNAYLIQEQISRTGLIFSSSFDIDNKIFMTGVPIAKSNWSRYDTGSNNGNINITINETDQGHSFSGDWFQSRSQQGQLLSTIQPNRGKLTLSGTENAPTLTSSFAFDLEEILYRDLHGKLWIADHIPSSQSVSLTSYSDNQSGQHLKELVDQLSPSNSKKVRQLMKRPKSFSAKAQHAPLIETHPSIDWEMSTTILTGTL